MGRKKEEKVTECGGFWRVLMTFPFISVNIIASEIGVIGVAGG